MKHLRKILVAFFSIILLLEHAYSEVSIFDQENISKLNKELTLEFSPQEEVHYDPALISIAAIIHSNNIDLKKEDFKEVELPFPKVPKSFISEINLEEYYQKNPVAYLRENKQSEKLYILFSPTFASYLGGLNNTVIHNLDSLHKKPNLLIFPGYLNEELTLNRATPLFPDFTGEYIAEDLYHRVYPLLQNFLQSGVKDIALIGLSGGGNIATQFLKSEKNYEEQLNYKASINKGALLFSPVVSLEESSKAIDSNTKYAIENEGWKASQHLSHWRSKIYLLSKNKNFLTDWKYVLSLKGSDIETANFIRKALMNEFIASDLKKVVNSSQSRNVEWDKLLYKEELNYSSQESLEKVWGYEDYFHGYALPENIKRKSSMRDFNFRNSTLLAALSEITSPVQIVFSMDDPIASLNAVEYEKMRRTNEYSSNTIIEKLLKEMDSLPHVRVDQKKYGSHLGYFLDGEFIKQKLLSL